MGDLEKRCVYCGSILQNSQKVFCNQQCQANKQYDDYIARWKTGLESGVHSDGRISKFLRRYVRNKYKDRCHKCGWSEPNPVIGRPLLQIDHIDGNGYNNKEENLVLLCPNCHSLTPTFGSLNFGHGRKARHKLG